MGTLVLMTSVDGGEKYGDRKVPWDPAIPDQVSQARAKFDDYVGKGFRAYRMGPKGSRGESPAYTQISFQEAVSRYTILSWNGALEFLRD